MDIKPLVKFEDLGRISYKAAWDYQEVTLKKLVAKKLAKRDNPELMDNAIHSLLFCEHNPVYTLGKSGTEDHLKRSKEELAAEGIEYFKINRGGDITYHGPGQITGYPIFDLDYFFRDVHRYVRTLEEVIILTIKNYGLEGIRMEGFTGVWLAPSGYFPIYRKICAIGVHLSRWVTMHGFALNVNTQLPYFENIIPCGIQDDNKAVTSMAKELGAEVDIDEVKSLLKQNFSKLFKYDYETK
jgi:lipoyl(octanoyl) transferase